MLRLPTLTEIAKSEAHLLWYEAGSLWYRVFFVPGSVEHFDFPVPVDDAGAGKFLSKMKGLNLLRWARKHLEFVQNAMADMRGSGMP